MAETYPVNSHHAPDVVTNTMTLLERFAFLLNYYCSGPLFGLNLKLIVLDRKPSTPEQFIALFWSVVFAAIIYYRLVPVLDFGLILALAPVLIYTFSDISQLVLEYRTYLSSLGMAIMAAFWLERLPLAAIPVVIFFIYLSRQRLKLFADPLLYWKQASVDCQRDPGVLSNYAYQLNRRGNFSEVDKVYRDLILNRVPECRSLLINVAAAKFGPTEMWDTVDPQRLKEAADILLEVTRRWPGHADGWRNLAVITYYQRDPMQAIVYFMAAISLDQRDSLSWLGRGQCHLDLGEYDLAADSLRRALDLSPQIAHIRVKLMEALQLAGRTEEFTALDMYLRDKNVIFVTDDMLPDEIRNRKN